MICGKRRSSITGGHGKPRALFTDKSRFENPPKVREKIQWVAQLEGVLSCYPQLRKEIDVEYIDFARPRSTIVELLGEENIELFLAERYGLGLAH